MVLLPYWFFIILMSAIIAIARVITAVSPPFLIRSSISSLKYIFTLAINCFFSTTGGMESLVGRSYMRDAAAAAAAAASIARTF